MNSQLEVSLNLTNQKIKFTGKARSNPEIVMDYFPPFGDGEGYTGLELLLMSLASCSATSIVGLLRKMNKDIRGFSVNARGIRREQHPTSFHTINLDFVLNSDNTADADLQKAINISEESLCPVWAMLKGNVEIITGFRIEK